VTVTKGAGKFVQANADLGQWGGAPEPALAPLATPDVKIVRLADGELIDLTQDDSVLAVPGALKWTRPGVWK
jgi:hypothetical protein